MQWLTLANLKPAILWHYLANAQNTPPAQFTNHYLMANVSLFYCIWYL